MRKILSGLALLALSGCCQEYAIIFEGELLIVDVPQTGEYLLEEAGARPEGESAWSCGVVMPGTVLDLGDL